MNRMILAAVLAVGVLACQGCLSQRFTANHNAEVDRVFVFRPMQNGNETKGMLVGADLLKLKGWYAAAKADPWGAAVNATGDAILGGLAVVGGNEIGAAWNLWDGWISGGNDNDNSSSSSSSTSNQSDDHSTDNSDKQESDQNVYNVNAGGDVTINNGDDNGNTEK